MLVNVLWLFSNHPEEGYLCLVWTTCTYYQLPCLYNMYILPAEKGAYSSARYISIKSLPETWRELNCIWGALRLVVGGKKRQNPSLGRDTLERNTGVLANSWLPLKLSCLSALTIFCLSFSHTIKPHIWTLASIVFDHCWLLFLCSKQICKWACSWPKVYKEWISHQCRKACSNFSIAVFHITAGDILPYGCLKTSVYSCKSCQKDLMDLSQTTGELNLKWVKTHMQGVLIPEKQVVISFWMFILVVRNSQLWSELRTVNRLFHKQPVF